MMQPNVLSGIERELVLKYLTDGNVPVTITPVKNEAENADSHEIKKLSSKVFFIEPEDLSVLKEGIILLKKAPEAVEEYKEKAVKVEFYFNRIGLYFVTDLKFVSSGPAIVIPKYIYRIPEVAVENKYDFTAVLYYSITGKEVSFFCAPYSNIELFSRPAWSSIELEKQEEAKKYLETMVGAARKRGKAGDGIQLINAAKYFVENKDAKVASIQGRVKPFDILFVNHERIMLGFEKNDAVIIHEGEEYALSMSFAIKETPSILRSVFVTCLVNNLYESENKKHLVADCIFTTLKEEDCRFLYEKATSRLFI